LRACAITSVARASQSWLWADRADIGSEEDPAIIFARAGESAQDAKPTRVVIGLDGVLTSLAPIFRIRWSILLSPANQSRIATILQEPYPRRPIAPERSGQIPCSETPYTSFGWAARTTAIDLARSGGEIRQPW
jgi:hypothetical protein